MRQNKWSITFLKSTNKKQNKTILSQSCLILTDVLSDRQMWTRLALCLLQCGALRIQIPSSCQPRPCSHPSSRQASSVGSMSALPFRTLHGKSPIWTSLITRPPNLSLHAAAGPGRSLLTTHWIHSSTQSKLKSPALGRSKPYIMCVSCCPSCFCAVVLRELRCLQKAAGFLSLNLSRIRLCVATTPLVPPPPQSCTYAVNTPSPSGTLRNRGRYINQVMFKEMSNMCAIVL